eukprot:609536-Pelagomonas_calceolata.AAC.1
MTNAGQRSSFEPFQGLRNYTCRYRLQGVGGKLSQWIPEKTTSLQATPFACNARQTLDFFKKVWSVGLKFFPHLLLHRNTKLFFFVPKLMLLAGEDQPQADQPNSLAEGLRVYLIYYNTNQRAPGGSLGARGPKAPGLWRISG